VAQGGLGCCAPPQALRVAVSLPRAPMESVPDTVADSELNGELARVAHRGPHPAPRGPNVSARPPEATLHGASAL